MKSQFEQNNNIESDKSKDLETLNNQFLKLSMESDDVFEKASMVDLENNSDFLKKISKFKRTQLLLSIAFSSLLVGSSIYTSKLMEDEVSDFTTTQQSTLENISNRLEQNHDEKMLQISDVKKNFEDINNMLETITEPGN